MSALVWICDECGEPLDARSPTAIACSSCGREIRRDASGAWAFADSFVPSGFAPSRREHLAEIERDHFWFPARRKLLARLLERHVAAGRAAIDLGCGGGGFLPELTDRFDRVVGIDAYDESLAAARLSSREAVLARADVSNVPLADDQFDLVVALDVLEHVEPLGLLREAARLAAPAGRLLISVPAFPCLWSPLDEAAGHRRRYRLSGLAEELAACGWRVVHHTHYQALVFPLVWWVRRFSSPALRRVERSPHPAVAAALAAVNELEVRLLGAFRIPWGSSLLVIARRTDGPAGEAPWS